MPFHKPARWVFPVSAGLLLYVALFDWFDDLWPDCPSGHSRVHLAVYCIFFFFCCDWISTASLSIWLANDSALSVKRMKRENDLLLPVPPCALPVFSLQSECTCALEALLSPELAVTATVATPACHVCSALHFILYLAGTELNWTVKLRKYDTICFLPCSSPGAWSQGISCYLSVLGPVK